jgi:hypothetical protein
MCDDINNLDYKQWKPHTSDEHMQAAQGWRKASTQAAREQWYAVYGVRWSELLQLPYWDPTHFMVIDSMHAFYPWLFQCHCRSIWGMDVNFNDRDGITFDCNPNAPTEAEMIEANLILERSTHVELNQLRCAIIRQLCKDVSLDWRGRKGLLLDQLLQYVHFSDKICDCY